MTYIRALIIFVVLILLIVGYLWGPLLLSRERPSRAAGGFAAGGSPTGGCDRVQHQYKPRLGQYFDPRLGQYFDPRGPGGWTTFNPSYHATTASSIAHMIELSA